MARREGTRAAEEEEEQGRRALLGGRAGGGWCPSRPGCVLGRAWRGLRGAAGCEALGGEEEEQEAAPRRCCREVA